MCINRAQAFEKHAKAQKPLEAAEHRYLLVLETLTALDSDGVQNFAEAVNELHELGEVQESMTQQYMIDPLKRFAKIFPAITKAFAEQKFAAQTLRKTKEKVAKQVGKGALADKEKVAKAQKASKEAEVADHEMHELATKDVPAVFELRSEYIHPCVVALLQSELLYLEKVEAAIEKAVTANDDGVFTPELWREPEKDESEYRAQTKSMLDEFQQLSIVWSA